MKDSRVIGLSEEEYEELGLGLMKGLEAPAELASLRALAGRQRDYVF